MILKKIKAKLDLIKKKNINRRFEKKLRGKLRQKDFSIICSNCIGGVIYHRLGLPFLSPTINLWMSQTDFLKFVLRLKYYLDCHLTFEDETDYPIGKLEDLTIHFNHYKTKEEAYNSWEKRKARINFDNLYIIMYDLDGIRKEDILKLGDVNCKNKIVFSENYYPDIPYVVTFQKQDRSQPFSFEFMKSDKYGIREFEKIFDFVNWLNCKNLE